MKDHWVVGKDDNVVLNKIKMLELMDGLPGIPKLVNYWVIEQSDVQQAVVEEHQILHWDCSLNNAIILDKPIINISSVVYPAVGGRPRIEEEEDSKEETWGCNLANKPKTPKSSSDSLALPVLYIIQGYFCGPNGMVQEYLPNSLVDHWTSLDLASCTAFKITFFAYPGEEKHLTDQFHLYFKQLIPLTVEWHKVLMDNIIHPITFNTILAVFNSHLDKLPNNEELVSAVDMLKNDAVILTKCIKGKQIASDLPSVVAPKQQKFHHNNTESDSALGSDA
ncbi:hypothetical protein BDR06DRAFT_972283 [Suillus hirtellus]|nr:hypothetical protein BDR06DRAFT_972283 [Suillus hirtellus]